MALEGSLARLMGVMKEIDESDKTFQEYVAECESEIEAKQDGIQEYIAGVDAEIATLQDNLAELKRLAEFSEETALTTPTGRKRRSDKGKPRGPKKGDGGVPPVGADSTADETVPVDNGGK